MKAAVLRERFAQLLDGFSRLADKEQASSPNTIRFRTLLEQFVEARQLADATERTDATDEHQRMSALLVGYNQAVGRYHQQQEQTADDFNLLEVMHLTGKEIRHSMVLAWLLDHDLRKLGTHAQGRLGFGLFLEEFSELGLSLNYANANYWVRREVAGDEAIVDIEIACREQFLIHIENKIWSSEGKDQTDREWADLQRQAEALNVRDPHIHGFFLTPHGDKPANAGFREISWGRIARVLDRFAERAKPEDVKLFAAHYARALRRFIVIQDIREDEYNGQTTDE